MEIDTDECLHAQIVSDDYTSMLILLRHLMDQLTPDMQFTPDMPIYTRHAIYQRGLFEANNGTVFACS